MSDCQICISPFNKSTNQNISCLKCHEGCCLKCIKTFLCSSKSDPTCMFCNEILSKYDLIKMKLPKSYLDKEYKLIRQDILFNNDKSHFQEAFVYVPEYVIHYNNHTEYLNKVNESHRYLYNMDEGTRDNLFLKMDSFNRLTKSLIGGGKDVDVILKKLLTLSKNKEMIEYKKHTELLYANKKKLDVCNNTIKRLSDRIKSERSGVKRRKQILTLFCQENSCNGMLNEKSNCITCKKSYCSKCNTTLTENHKCSENDIKSFDSIKKQTKSCPECFIPIYKIQGCDQMFCTSCHTPFSWNTGNVLSDTGFFHNPHYMEHLDNGGDNIFDGGRFRREQQVPILWQDLSLQLINLNISRRNEIRELYRRLIELFDIKLNRFTEDPNKKVERVKFLSNEISPMQYKQFLSKEDNKKEFLYNIDKIYEVFYNKVFDLLKGFIPPSSNCMDNFKSNLNIITNECSDCMTNICKDFGSRSTQYNFVITNCIPKKLKL